MPQTPGQKVGFAFITVLITVHAFVFYSIFVLNGETLTQYASMFQGEPVSYVLDAIEILGGIEVLGIAMPVWTVILIEFVLAFGLEIVWGSPLSLRLASRAVDPNSAQPVLFETAIICATVVLMCPAMSLFAAVLYYPYTTMDFNAGRFLANWLQLICLNLPFAFFSQLFFIQPFLHLVFPRLLKLFHWRRSAS